jgi:hypothetical protein
VNKRNGTKERMTGFYASNPLIISLVWQLNQRSFPSIFDYTKALKKRLMAKKGTLKIKHSASLDESMEELMSKSSKKVKNLKSKI